MTDALLVRVEVGLGGPRLGHSLLLSCLHHISIFSCILSYTLLYIYQETLFLFYDMSPGNGVSLDEGWCFLMSCTLRRLHRCEINVFESWILNLDMTWHDMTWCDMTWHDMMWPHHTTYILAGWWNISTKYLQFYAKPMGLHFKPRNKAFCSITNISVVKP